jgi:hypothetical protein
MLVAEGRQSFKEKTLEPSARTQKVLELVSLSELKRRITFCAIRRMLSRLQLFGVNSQLA